MKITKKEIQIGLNQLVAIKFLQEKDGRYNYHPNYKKTLLNSKGNKINEILMDALYRGGYFVTFKSEREVFVVFNLLLLK